LNQHVPQWLAALALALVTLPLIVYSAYRIGWIEGHVETPAAMPHRLRPPRPAPTAVPRPATDETIDPSYLETDVSDLLQLDSLEAIRRRRLQLAQFIWGPHGLPQDVRPTRIEPDYDDPRYDRLREVGLASLELWVVEMDFGLRSSIYRFVPRAPRGTPVFVHQGHRGDFILSIDLISALLAQGHEVFGFAMPLHGMNNKPTVSFPHLGRVKLSTHDSLKLLKPHEGHPVKYLLEPVVAVLNEIWSRSSNPPTIAMVGISGGGWTTTLMAALDARVRLSIPVAGSYPIYLRSGSKRDWGDWEQTLPGLYRVANYPEMYVMGAAGKNRRQIQILNKYDPCCFAGVKSKTYADKVRQQVAHLRAGSWDLFLDDSHTEHAVSPLARERILRESDTPASR